MAGMTTKGACRLCGRTLGRTGMGRHLEACLKKQAASKPAGAEKAERTRVFHLEVHGRNMPVYWMHLHVPADFALVDLDGFLRDTWLECYGHMSAFTIGGRQHSCAPMIDFDDQDMSASLGGVLTPGTTFDHDYDFGSTTYLTLRVVAKRQVDGRLTSVEVLARNDPPTFPCASCGKPATWTCTECMYDGTGDLCDDCAPAHECGEEMMLPLVNSPRAGVCGYPGPEDEFRQRLDRVKERHTDAGA